MGIAGHQTSVVLGRGARGACQTGRDHLRSSAGRRRSERSSASLGASGCLEAQPTPTPQGAGGGGTTCLFSVGLGGGWGRVRENLNVGINVFVFV